MSMMVLFGYGVYILWKDIKDFFNRKMRRKEKDGKVLTFDEAENCPS